MSFPAPPKSFLVFFLAVALVALLGAFLAGFFSFLGAVEVEEEAAEVDVEYETLSFFTRVVTIILVYIYMREEKESL
jgi:hypothetical protein